MTKQDVIRQIVARTESDPLIGRLVIETFFEVVKDSLTEGKPIYIRQFGSFILKRRAQKIGRHIKQNKAITVAAHVIPAFKPSDDFANQIKAQDVPAFAKKKNSSEKGPVGQSA